MSICGMNITSQADLDFNTDVTSTPPNCPDGTWNGARFYINDFDGNITFPDELFSNQIVFLDNPSLGAVDLSEMDYTNVLEFDAGSTDFRYLIFPDIPDDAIGSSIGNLFFYGEEGRGWTDQGPDTIVYGDMYDGLLYLTMNNNYMVFQDLKMINTLTLKEACIQGSSLKTVKQADITAPTCEMDIYLRGVEADALDYLELYDVSAALLNGGVERAVKSKMTIEGINTNEAYGETSKVANLNQITKVGQSLNIAAADGVSITFDKLESAGSLNVTGNNNCDLSFKNLNNIQDDIVMTGNGGDTMIPGDMQALERVGSVHLNGIIGGPLGSNIFPALTSATGSITIEAWNDDFDCGPLLDLKKQSKIGGSVSCNGTATTSTTTTTTTGTNNNSGATGTPTSGEGDATNTSIPDGTTSVDPGTKSEEDPSSDSDSGNALSPGAEAAIGAMAGIIGLGIVGALLWFFVLRPRRRKAKQQEEAERMEKERNAQMILGDQQQGGFDNRDFKTGGDDTMPLSAKAAAAELSSPPSSDMDNRNNYFHEIDSTGPERYEMETHEREVEMLADGPTVYHELDSIQLPAAELDGQQQKRNRRRGGGER